MASWERYSDSFKERYILVCCEGASFVGLSQENYLLVVCLLTGKEALKVISIYRKIIAGTLHGHASFANQYVILFFPFYTNNSAVPMAAEFSVYDVSSCHAECVPYSSNSNRDY